MQKHLQASTSHKPFQPYAEHRVMNVYSDVVHLGHLTPKCMGATWISSYVGSFQPVTCKRCLERHPEAAWPTPQRATTELGKWVIMDFGFAIVAACKVFGGGWRATVTPASKGAALPVVYCGGKGSKTYRQIFNSLIQYINNGLSWKAKTTFCAISKE